VAVGEASVGELVVNKVVSSVGVAERVLSKVVGGATRCCSVCGEVGGAVVVLGR